MGFIRRRGRRASLSEGNTKIKNRETPLVCIHIKKHKALKWNRRVNGRSITVAKCPTSDEHPRHMCKFWNGSATTVIKASLSRTCNWGIRFPAFKICEKPERATK